ncbi:MAG: glycosyltransferase, partial [Ignavibacteria bacterium]|nr:glycosyltransferase [Ignavibacteria bacterium]
MTVDTVILSRCTSAETFEINKECVRTLIESEPDIRFSIVIVESNKDFAGLDFSYVQKNVTVIVPDEPFRFHRFLNIGLDHGESETVIFSNNDVRFHPGWLAEILKVRELNPEIRSFSPFDRNGPYLRHEEFSQKRFHIGYRVPVEFTG